MQRSWKLLTTFSESLGVLENLEIFLQEKERKSLEFSFKKILNSRGKKYKTPLKSIQP